VPIGTLMVVAYVARPHAHSLRASIPRHRTAVISLNVWHNSDIIEANFVLNIRLGVNRGQRAG